MSTVITPTEVRDYLDLNQPGSTSSYSDATIGSNIRAAQRFLERRTGRFFIDRPAVTWVIPGATMLRAQVPIPGFRAFTSVTWGGSSLTVGFQPGGSASCWAIPDQLNTGVYVALQFRAWRADNDRPWWYANPNWFDQLNDSPYYPGNLGGGFAWTSMPDDLVVVGDGGYDSSVAIDTPPGYPEDFTHVVKVLAGFYTFRPRSILADVAITPAGGVLNYTQLPAEVVQFIADNKIGGDQAVSV